MVLPNYYNIISRTQWCVGVEGKRIQPWTRTLENTTTYTYSIPIVDGGWGEVFDQSATLCFIYSRDAAAMSFPRRLVP